jgi:hypothetical protein
MVLTDIPHGSAVSLWRTDLRKERIPDRNTIRDVIAVNMPLLISGCPSELYTSVEFRLHDGVLQHMGMLSE